LEAVHEPLPFWYLCSLSRCLLSTVWGRSESAYHKSTLFKPSFRYRRKWTKLSFAITFSPLIIKTITACDRNYCNRRTLDCRCLMIVSSRVLAIVYKKHGPCSCEHVTVRSSSECVYIIF
jgi:hypothetical protein